LIGVDQNARYKFWVERLAEAQRYYPVLRPQVLALLARLNGPGERE
jgi:hypothetical protein